MSVYWFAKMRYLHWVKPSESSLLTTERAAAWQTSTRCFLWSETFRWWTLEVNPLPLTQPSGPGCLNWSCSSQWMWLITGQLAGGTCANTEEGEQLKWESLPPLLQNCFNDFPTSCFIFMSSVLSAYRKGLPASEMDQLCIPLNMYICAFVYSIGVDFFLSSPQRKIKEASHPHFVNAWVLTNTDDFLCDPYYLPPHHLGASNILLQWSSWSPRSRLIILDYTAQRKDGGNPPSTEKESKGWFGTVSTQRRVFVLEVAGIKRAW